MSAGEKISDAILTSQRRAWRLKLAGVIILILGLGGAGMVYWLGTRAPDVSDDLSMVGYNRAEERQMGMLYGKQGRLVEDLFNDLKQPGTQAFIIAAVSAFVAAGCFYAARNPADDNGATGQTGLPPN